MPPVQCQFINPANPGGDFYLWARNHSTEQSAGKTRAITHTARTDAVGLVRQQGEPDPYVLKFDGTIAARDQHRQMWRWFELCNGQTIYFQDFDGQKYEVQITHYEETRVRNITRPTHDPATHQWTFVIEMEVYAFLVGDLHDMVVTP